MRVDELMCTKALGKRHQSICNFEPKTLQSARWDVVLQSEEKAFCEWN